MFILSKGGRYGAYQKRGCEDRHCQSHLVFGVSTSERKCNKSDEGKKGGASGPRRCAYIGVDRDIFVRNVRDLFALPLEPIATGMSPAVRSGARG